MKAARRLELAKSNTSAFRRSRLAWCADRPAVRKELGLCAHGQGRALDSFMLMSWLVGLSLVRKGLSVS